MIDRMKVTLARWATGTRTLLAQLRGAGSEGRDDDAEAHDDAEVLQPLGLRAAPTIRSTLEAIVVDHGGRQVVLHLVDKDRQAGAVEPEAGGALLHSLAQQATHVYLRADGSIEIATANNGHVTVTAHGTGEIRLNGAALKVAADTDAADLGTWTHVPAAGAGVTPCTLAYTPPGGAPTSISPDGTAVGGRIAVTAARRVKTTA